MEVGEVLFQLLEVFQIEHLVESACTIERVHFAITAIQRTGHVHDLRTEGSHTGTTTDPNHFFLRIEMGMEVAIRTTHDYFVAGFKRKDVR